MPKGERYRGCFILTVVPLDMLHDTIPPTEGATHLHLPLQLHALPNSHSVEASKHAIWIDLGGSRRRDLWLQLRGSGIWAEAQSLGSFIRDALGKNVARADVTSDVRLRLLLPGDLRNHARHGEANFLLPVEDFEHFLDSSQHHLLVHLLPISPGWGLGLVPKAGVECRPLGRKQSLPLSTPNLPAVVCNGLGAETKANDHVERRIEEFEDVRGDRE
mmetsp:Transcript_27432/g.63900  ORF Transcript_27432/g.63900 Transcript_27432/m.63900 type:complete len:217 (+) Transcript_27432:712-1362(+)